MLRSIVTTLFVVTVFSAFSLGDEPPAKPEGEEKGKEEASEVSFSKTIVPLFVDKCLGCHNADTTEGEYSMTTFESLMAGGPRGKAIEPSKPEESVLSQMVHGIEEPAMPFEDDKLDDELIASLDSWIRQGAKFDGKDVKAPIEDLLPKPEPVVDKNYTTPVPIAALVYRPDGKVIAASGYHEITLWDAETGKLAGRIATKSERIQDLAFTSDGKFLLHAGGTPGEFGEVAVWDAASGELVRSLFEGDDVCFALAVRPGTNEVAAGGTDRIFRIWNMTTGEELHSVENHADWILDLAYTPDGKRLLTASRDRSAKVWDQTTAEPILTFASHTDAVYGIASNNDGTMAASTGADQHLRIWKTDGNGDQVKDIGAHGDVACGMVFAPSGKFVVTVGNDRKVKVWNPADGKLIREMAGHEDYVYSVALSPDETRVATGGWDGDIRIWNVENGELVLQLIAVPALATAEAAKP